MKKNEKLLERGNFLYGPMYSITKLHDIYISHYLKEEDITLSQYYMLLYLFVDENATQSDIANLLLMDRCGVSRAFKEFEKKDLITREVNKNNKRAYKIQLTDKSKEIFNKFTQIEHKWENMICNEVNMNREDLFKRLKELSIKSFEFNDETIN